MSAFEKAVRAAMARAGMNVKDTAEAVGRTPQAVHKWIKGTGGTVRTLDACASAWGTTACEVLRERDELAQ